MVSKDVDTPRRLRREGCKENFHGQFGQEVRMPV